jgi:hypothetical protein
VPRRFGAGAWPSHHVPAEVMVSVSDSDSFLGDYMRSQHAALPLREIWSRLSAALGGSTAATTVTKPAANFYLAQCTFLTAPGAGTPCSLPELADFVKTCGHRCGVCPFTRLIAVSTACSGPPSQLLTRPSLWKRICGRPRLILQRTCITMPWETCW